MKEPKAQLSNKAELKISMADSMEEKAKFRWSTSGTWCLYMLILCTTVLTVQLGPVYIHIANHSTKLLESIVAPQHT